MRRATPSRPTCWRRSGARADGARSHRPAAGTLPGDDRAAVFRAAAAAVYRSGAAAQPGYGVDRIHSRALPEAAEEDVWKRRGSDGRQSPGMPGLEELVRTWRRSRNARRRHQLLQSRARPLAARDGHAPIRRSGAPDARGSDSRPSGWPARRAWLADRLGDDASRAAGLRAHGPHRTTAGASTRSRSSTLPGSRSPSTSAWATDAGGRAARSTAPCKP